MRILITNDDSISSPVLLPLAKWAQKLGDVTVVAPKYEQSGKSHGVELHQAYEVKPVKLGDFEAYTVDSTPADCVRFAIAGLKRSFDLVISGINKGLNAGSDILYSGTAAAIFEAGVQGIPGIALSTFPDSFDSALAQLDTALAFFREHKLMEKHSLYNVNFPREMKGIRITRQGGPIYSDEFDPIGNDLYMPRGIFVYRNTGDNAYDTNAVHNGYISVSPLTVQRIPEDILSKLEYLNQ